MNEKSIKKYIDLSREFIKKASKYTKSNSNIIFNSGKSILKSVISILNNSMSMVVKSKSPKAQVLKTTLSGLLITAGGLYAGIQAHKVITPSKKEIVQSSKTPKKTLSKKTNQILYSYDEKPQCEASHMPSYINISMTWGGPNNTFALRGFKEISPPSIIVTSSGNKWPKPTPYNKSMASKEFDVIMVGSLSPKANPSTFSQYGDKSKESEPPAILAPSDYSITTTNDNGDYKRFSGTSGATPLVTGALAGFSWLSGYQPTGAEAKILLEKTAIPLSTSHDKERNGPGMLNAYKLGMVAQRLKEECGEYINCFKSKIQNPATYEFPEDPNILAEVDKSFPECSSSKCFQKKESCENVGETFQRLRKAAFLNPHKKEYWRYLSCIYASAGFTDNAKGMRNIYNGLLGAKYIRSTFDKPEDFIDKSCQVNEDCIYVSNCRYDHTHKKYWSHEIWLRPANKDYVSECQGIVPCGNSCRCGSNKRERKAYKTIKDKEGKMKSIYSKVRLACVDSQCVEEISDLKKNPPSAEDKSGQR